MAGWEKRIIAATAPTTQVMSAGTSQLAREARAVAPENRVAPIVTEGVGADVGVDGVVRAMARAGLQTAAGQTAAAGARATGADRTRVAAPASRSLSRNRRSW